MSTPSGPGPAPQPGALPELDRLAADVDRLLALIGEGADRLDARFARTAARYAARTAVSDADGEVTFLELDWLATETARRLEGRARPGSPVALRLSGSRHAPAAVLGVLRAGFTPLPAAPDATVGGALVVTDLGPAADETPLAKSGPFVIAGREAPADGQAVGTARVLARLDGSAALLGTGPDDVWLAAHPPGSAPAGREPWEPLLNGARLLLADPHDEPPHLARLVERGGVTVFDGTPGLFAALVAGAVAGHVRLPALRRVVVTGGPRPTDVERWRDAAVAPDAVLLGWDAEGVAYEV
ncbi:hypothetical protein E2C00_31220 [Streptomyces sp. WAC05374]|uniref:AMP-binding protein n=1 Tax=Streptomyces sp. WAC05374 TaxID=2487420 RepID=UPI000F8634C1|nr:AMP-binding protein [Streptomyces sp. WAC05374]RST02538.1 hypothetical protein EF905_34725 [Streptomyces sp. WAC05374]TDF39093.1 hypothetical protein E2B92_26625 [Streptomyces sp. WAC05374]TDF47484.1 hypothetical protein E2C02_30535 [Streptomyces sp. WAC05374]TDF48201.1 hypothetical protein E2C00_31220 [Streptomyces sp. WAC05374]